MVPSFFFQGSRWLPQVWISLLTESCNPSSTSVDSSVRRLRLLYHTPKSALPLTSTCMSTQKLEQTVTSGAVTNIKDMLQSDFWQTRWNWQWAILAQKALIDPTTSNLSIQQSTYWTNETLLISLILLFILAKSSSSKVISQLVNQQAGFQDLPATC